MQVNFNVLNINSKKQNYMSNPRKIGNIGEGHQLLNYKPVAYKDYNITFSARLFRSPENFYAQDFNEKNMPNSMHKYIYESYDSDFKKTIPPAQAMKEVFGKIKFAKDLDAVKMMFPDEPLFENLTSIPNKKSREGLLGMINLLKEDPEYKDKTLFKNGDDDLGMYILKKIYVDGKTLKEINKDFVKDVSVHFKSYDIKPQDYNAFGIKFPQKSFWKSFVATREDFPYVYILRNSSEKITNTHANGTETSNNESQPVKKQRKPMSQEQRNRLSEFMINWHANLTPEQKEELKRKHQIGLEESVFHNYFGEVITIAQDKVKLADNMAEYMEKTYGNPDYLSFIKDNKEKQSRVMKRFWKENGSIRHNYSKTMKEIIAKFDEAYGEDGGNYDFLRLLALARNIKEINEEGRQIRNQMRLEAANKNAPVIIAEDIPEVEVNSVKEEIPMVFDEKTVPTTEQLHRIAKKMNGDIFEINLKDGTVVSLVINLKEEITKRINEEMQFFPQSFTNSFIKFMLTHPLADKKYLTSLIVTYELESEELGIKESSFLGAGISSEILKSSEVKSQFYSRDEINEISRKIHKDFDEQNPKRETVCAQILLEILSNENISPNNLHLAAFMDSSELGNLLRAHRFNNPFSPELAKAVNENYNEYRKDLSPKEINKLYLKFNESLIKINCNNLASRDTMGGLLIKAVSTNVKNNPAAKKIFIDHIRSIGIINKNSGHLRFLLDENVPVNLVEATIEKMLIDIIKNDITIINFIASVDKNLLETQVKPYDYDLYLKLKKLNDMTESKMQRVLSRK